MKSNRTSGRLPKGNRFGSVSECTGLAHSATTNPMQRPQGERALDQPGTNEDFRCCTE
jgi:hypothetical protein